MRVQKVEGIGFLSSDHRQWGATVEGEGARFRVWAPACQSVEVEWLCGSTISHAALVADSHGYYSGLVPGVKAGDRYRFRLNGNHSRPDPASRFQPETVHGWSQVIDGSRFLWRDQAWRGVHKDRLIIYELHVGTFTNEGTFAAAMERLPELLELGITAIELMPVAESAGRWNWGYDGVHLFAVRNTFGDPDSMRAFVDECHQLGIAVILDVVYNHPGPEGNYLAEFGGYFSDRHGTPWGPAYNYDGDQSRHVRDFILANVTYWLEEFHLDGLRLDAVHFMFDDSRPSILTELTRTVDCLQQRLGRRLYVIGETNVHDVHALSAREQEGIGMDAIWCDDFMHSILSIAMPHPPLTHRNYFGAPDLAEVLEHGYLYHGADFQRVTHRTPELRPDYGSLVIGLQNHDSVGNHPRGLRLHQFSSVAFQRAAAALVLLHPAIPLLFMGEEFASPHPFLFFVDFTDDYLRKIIADSRALEYTQHDWQEAISPVDDRAFNHSRCGEIAEGDMGVWKWYQSLLALRKTWQQESILDQHHLQVGWQRTSDLFMMHYETRSSEPAFVVARLVGPDTQVDPLVMKLEGQLLLHSDAAEFGGSIDQAASTQEGSVVLHANQAMAGRGRLEAYST